MRHILISGERGAGKSTLIARLVSAFDGPVYGFCTKRLLEPDAEGRQQRRKSAAIAKLTLPAGAIQGCMTGVPPCSIRSARHI